MYGVIYVDKVIRTQYRWIAGRDTGIGRWCRETAQNWSVRGNSPISEIQKIDAACQQRPEINELLGTDEKERWSNILEMIQSLVR